MSWKTILKAKTIESIYNELKSRNFVLPLGELEITSSSIMPDGSQNPQFRDKYNTLRGGRKDHVYAHEKYEGAKTEYEETITAKYSKMPEEVESAAIEQYKNTPEGLRGVENKIGNYTIYTRKAINHDKDDIFVEFEINIEDEDLHTNLSHELAVRIDEEYVRESKKNTDFDAQSMRRIGQDAGDYKASQFADRMEF